MEYAGKGNFMFIAPVSKQFRDCYTDLYPGHETSSKGFVSDSLQCAKACYGHVNENFTINTIIWAGRKGQADIVEYAINHYWIDNDIHNHWVIFNDHEEEIGRHLDVMKLIQKHKFLCNWHDCCIRAIEIRNKELIAWMTDNLHDPGHSNEVRHAVCHYIAKHNDLDLLNWAWEKKYEWISQAFYYAVCWGSIDMLDYCLENNFPYDKDEDYCGAASNYGKLENLKWLYDHSFPWKETCHQAAVQGILMI